MIKQWGEWLNEKRIHAGIAAVACMMTSIIYLPGTFLASIVVAFTTLRHGAKFGLTVLAWVAIPAIVLGIEGQLSAFAVGLIHCSMVFVLALVLRNTHSWNSLLFLMTIILIIIIALVHLWVPDISGVWNTILSQFMQNWVEQGQTEPTYWASTVSVFTKFGTGIVAFALMSFMMLQLMIARFWQSAIYNKNAFKREILKIRINCWVSLVLPGVLLIAVMSPHAFLWDALPVILFGFIIAGFVVLHTFALTKPQAGLVVLLAYIATFIFIYLICLWALVGFLDAWINFPWRAKAFELLKKGDN
jgi:hypothetical protein